MKWLKLQVVVERRERERYGVEVARENPLKLTRNCFFPWRENILSSSLFLLGRWALIVIYCNAFKRFIKVNEKLLRRSCDRRRVDESFLAFFHEYCWLLTISGHAEA